MVSHAWSGGSEWEEQDSNLRRLRRRFYSSRSLPILRNLRATRMLPSEPISRGHPSDSGVPTADRFVHLRRSFGRVLAARWRQTLSNRGERDRLSDTDRPAPCSCRSRPQPPGGRGRLFWTAAGGVAARCPGACGRMLPPPVADRERFNRPGISATLPRMTPTVGGSDRLRRQHAGMIGQQHDRLANRHRHGRSRRRGPRLTVWERFRSAADARRRQAESISAWADMSPSDGTTPPAGGWLRLHIQNGTNQLAYFAIASIVGEGAGPPPQAPRDPEWDSTATTGSAPSSVGSHLARRRHGYPATTACRYGSRRTRLPRRRRSLMGTAGQRQA